MSSNKADRAVAAPSISELRTAAQALFLDADQSELDFFAAAMGGLVDDFNAIDAMAAPKLETKYARGEGYRPTGDENRYGAWQWKWPGGRPNSIQPASPCPSESTVSGTNG